MTFIIRAADAFDTLAIRSLTLDGINVWANDILTNIKPWVDTTCSEDNFTAKINDSNNHFFVAEMGDTIVGTVFINTSDPVTSYMGGLYCSVKQCGIGTALLRHTFEESLMRGYCNMECEIYENNFASISLMQKYGAEPTSSETVAEAKYVTYKFSLSQEPAYV